MFIWDFFKYSGFLPQSKDLTSQPSKDKLDRRMDADELTNRWMDDGCMDFI